MILNYYMIVIIQIQLLINDLQDLVSVTPFSITLRAQTTTVPKTTYTLFIFAASIQKYCRPLKKQRIRRISFCLPLYPRFSQISYTSFINVYKTWVLLSGVINPAQYFQSKARRNFRHWNEKREASMELPARRSFPLDFQLKFHRVARSRGKKKNERRANEKLIAALRGAYRGQRWAEKVNSRRSRDTGRINQPLIESWPGRSGWMNATEQPE